MEIKDRRIALLIDSENVSYKAYPIIIDELDQYGTIIYKRIYGDFASKAMPEAWIKIIQENAIEQIQQVSSSKGKNSSDSKLIINAMDILYRGKADCFCIVSSDGDFTSLAIRLKNDDVIVIGAGENNKAPLAYRKACDIFIPIDELMSTTNVDKKKDELVLICKEIIKENSGEDNYCDFNTFLNVLRKKKNDFSPKLYGMNTSRPSIFFKNIKKSNKCLFKLETRDNNKLYIKLD